MHFLKKTNTSFLFEVIFAFSLITLHSSLASEQFCKLELFLKETTVKAGDSIHFRYEYENWQALIDDGFDLSYELSVVLRIFNEKTDYNHAIDFDLSSNKDEYAKYPLPSCLSADDKYQLKVGNIHGLRKDGNYSSCSQARVNVTVIPVYEKPTCYVCGPCKFCGEADDGLDKVCQENVCKVNSACEAIQLSRAANFDRNIKCDKEMDCPGGLKGMTSQRCFNKPKYNILDPSPTSYRCVNAIFSQRQGPCEGYHRGTKVSGARTCWEF